MLSARDKDLCFFPLSVVLQVVSSMLMMMMMMMTTKSNFGIMVYIIMTCMVVESAAV